MTQNNKQRIDTEIDYEEELAKSSRKQQYGLRKMRQRVSTVVDYVLTLLPIIAPVPNLINLAIALSPVMGQVAAVIAAVAFELLLFGSAEIILHLQEKQLRDGGYKWPLRMAVGCGSIFITILLILIGHYEVPLHGWAVMTLPFVSVISIAFLSLKKWSDIRDSISRDNAKYHDELTITKEQIDSLRGELIAEREQSEVQHNELELLNTELDKLRENLEANGGELVQYTEKLNFTEIELERVSGELIVERERANALEHELNTRSMNGGERTNSTSSTPTAERRSELFTILCDEYMGVDVSSLNKTVLAQRLDTSHTTISRDLKALEKQGLIYLNGIVNIVNAAELDEQFVTEVNLTKGEL